MYHTDLLYLKLLAGCLKGGSPDSHWKKITGSLDLPSTFLPLLRYFSSPFHAEKIKPAKGGALKRQIAALNRVIFDWKSPLATEWFSFLQGLKQDLMLGDPVLRGQSRKKILRKFPDALQRLLKDK